MPKNTRSIGQVLATVRMEFPDVSISKIRFLESEGLLSPERAPSGFRKYAEDDVERLRYILRMQRDHYLPLKVIREHLDLLDRGLNPPSLDAQREAPAAPAVVAPNEDLAATPARPLQLTRAELIAQSGISEAALVELERQFLVQPSRGTTCYGRDALTIVVAARKLAPFGLDARHLRTVKQCAERELGLVDDVLAPLLRRNPDARQASAEVTHLVAHAHAAMMRMALDRSAPAASGAVSPRR